MIATWVSKHREVSALSGRVHDSLMSEINGS